MGKMHRLYVFDLGAIAIYDRFFSAGRTIDFVSQMTFEVVIK